MSNPFEEITKKLDSVILKLDEIQAVKSVPNKIPFKEFLIEHGISRPTGYAWHNRGLISLEKIGGRQFVDRDSIKIAQKYQRA